MKKEQIYSIVTALLTLAGSYLLGKSVFGISVDTTSWEAITGAILTVGGIVMSILDKSLTIEKLQASLRTVIIAVGGLFVGAGKLDASKIEVWLGFIAAIVPMLYTWLSKKKNQQIETGEVKVDQLKK